ncbi:protein of unknown function DUF790 [Magnetococcus marinus MC-1]|uniref:DUF790 family protein n=1 Tax=Magnetococcus marinus (strain ATCC BAA-1437 / JCM 17883 / MC-1) TaxID=156889 RepID=A0L5C6_MAGMM|nr:DUF790 family protein [Magnetococcus marinus]ABK43169.1 protein of unknown function DUF790 [Magnetococcus marinus MC-1]
MLTKEHMRFSQRGGILKPGFIDVNNRTLLNAVEALTELFQHGAGLTRAELAEQCEPIIATGFKNPKILRGIEKLLLDRCQFAEPDESAMQRRSAIFAKAAELLEQAHLEELPRYRSAIGQAFNSDPEQLAAALYNDLPERQPLLTFRPLQAQKMLYRYNAAQVQGLLLRAERLTLTFNANDPGTLRLLLQQLRFHRLLARVTRLPHEQVKMVLDGPVSVLEQTQKYGLQLALFFPILLLQKGWSLEALIRPQGKPAATLKLDPSAPLSYWNSHTRAYRPDAEFAQFAANFREKFPDWTVDEHPPLLDLGQQEICAPDMAFHKGEHPFYLELFHRWHATPLLRRLEHLSKRGRDKPPLILGVERSLLKNSQVAQALESSPLFAQRGFMFRDLPSSRTLAKLLETLI